MSEKNEIERYIEEAMSLALIGIDGDRVYHPLYKAWKLSIQQPALLREINNYSITGIGFFQFLSFGTINDIDDMQQIASLAYLFISKSLKKGDNSFDYKNRLLLIDCCYLEHEKYFKNVRDAFQYTVSAALDTNKNNDIFSIMLFGSSETMDALRYMEYHDLSKVENLERFEGLYNRKKELDLCIGTGKTFDKKETAQTIIQKGGEYHQQVLAYLENKVLNNLDLDF